MTYINHKGNLYTDIAFLSWSMCKEITGLGLTEVYHNALSQQSDDAIIILEPLAVYNLRVDFV